MSIGFYKRRRGILEHIEAGEIDLLESGIHDWLSLKANLLIGSESSIPVGVCFTSAPAIRPYCKRWVKSDRTMQRILEHMEEIGWIKTWPTQSGNYPTLICRASVHDLSGNEYRINADATTDWRNPIYELVGQLSGSCPQVVRKVATLREERAEKREEKPLAAKPAPPADERHQPFVNFAFEAFRKKFLQPPHWGPKHYKGLSLFLGRHKHVTQEEWERRYLNFLGSTDRFYQQEHGSLVIFVGHFDSFIDGPVLERKSNGELVTFAEKRSQKNADAIQRVLGRAEEASRDIRRALSPIHH